MRDDDGDLRLDELLDRSFGTGPDGLPTPSERLATGRQALRRRHRAGIAAATAAVVAVVGLGVGLSGAVGGGSSADGPVSGTTATPPTASDAPHDRARIEHARLSDRFPASFASDGTLDVRDGWHVVQKVEEPLGLQPPLKSLGVVVSDGQHTRWMLISLDEARRAGHSASMSSSATDPGEAYSRFEDWLSTQVALAEGRSNDGQVLVVGADDSLVPANGGELVEERPAPEIPRYTGVGDRLAEVVVDGRTWFVVVRGHGADALVDPVDAEVLTAPTFDAFIAKVTTSIESGDGLR